MPITKRDPRSAVSLTELMTDTSEAQENIYTIIIPLQDEEVKQNGADAAKLATELNARSPTPYNPSFSALPEHQKTAICRCVISMTRRLFEDPAVREDYERWKAEYYKTQNNSLGGQETC